MLHLTEAPNACTQCRCGRRCCRRLDRHQRRRRCRSDRSGNERECGRDWRQCRRSCLRHRWVCRPLQAASVGGVRFSGSMTRAALRRVQLTHVANLCRDRAQHGYR